MSYVARHAAASVAEVVSSALGHCDGCAVDDELVSPVEVDGVVHVLCESCYLDSPAA